MLNGYVVALLKSIDNSIYVFDSHECNHYGVPDPNGTVIVMKCTNISELEKYLSSLSLLLNSIYFEIVPVEFYTGIVEDPFISKPEQSSSKAKRLQETDVQRQNRLQKAREYRRKKLSEETESQRQVRLNKKKNCPYKQSFK